MTWGNLELGRVRCGLWFKCHQLSIHATLRKRSTMIASFFAGVYIFRIIRNDLLKNYFLGRGMEEQVLPRFQNP